MVYELHFCLCSVMHFWNRWKESRLLAFATLCNLFLQLEKLRQIKKIMKIFMTRPKNEITGISFVLDSLY